tara:strand:- start:417 stop:1463 length:1047 start_codon:yes stop_codon:yes gene_type:complete
MFKPVLGIIGGGQLGSMLAVSAKKLDIRTVTFSDDKDSPAKYFSDELVFGDYSNIDKIKEFCFKVDIITYEFENIPFETLDTINSYKKVIPRPEINKVVQNRLSEKDFINKCNLRTTMYNSVNSDKDLSTNNNLIPGILKTTTLGYDGKGQIRVLSINDLENIKIDYKRRYIFEKLVDLLKEFSVIITRFGHQKYEVYEPIENVHQDQILRYSETPAKINKKIFDKSIEWASIISEELDYIGTMCVEFFIDKNENLYVNEIAPRVHNSGHLTINSYNVSQFENHIRAVCGLEKIKLKKLKDAKMINIIGNDIEIYKNKKLNENEFFFDYLKKEIKDKRKMGHLTIIKN